jgi:hypothetical protein
MSEPLDDLRALLGAVEPSVEFERRTLRHVAADAKASRAGRRWMFVAPAAVAAIVIAIVSIWPAAPTRSGGGLGDQVGLPVRGSVSPAPSGALGDQAALPATAASSRRVHRVRPIDAAWKIPENAHADQAIAVHQLMTLIRAGKARIDGSVVAATDDGPIPALAPIELQPIVIAPLPNGQGGGSQR